MLTTTLLAAIASTMTLAAEPMDEQQITREGTGEHRATLDASELTRFDVSLFAGLDAWRNGDPLTGEAIDGKVVAIVFWNNDNATSVRTIVPTLKRLEMSYARDGLISLAVHSPDAWGDALARIDSGLISTLAAHDATGSFAVALGADDTPDVFLIDRAGQLRFADIDQRQLPTAVRGLLRETREEALAAGERRVVAARLAEAEAKAQAARDARDAARDAGGEEGEEDLPPKPEAEAYAQLTWPKFTDAKALSAKDVQGKPLPVPFGTKEKWLSKKLPTESRVIVLDFWATWCGPCIKASPKLDSLQKRYMDDLRVIGVAGQASGGNYPEDEASIRAYMQKHKVAYSHVIDPAQSVYRSLQVRGIPHVVVLSTDGVVRWQGNPHAAEFTQVVEQVIANDPWAKARREKE